MIKKVLLFCIISVVIFIPIFFSASQASAVTVLDCDLQNLVNTNSEVKILNDCTIGDGIVTISKPVVVDGNGKTIRGPGRIIITSSDVTIKNLKTDGLGVTDKDVAKSASISVQGDSKNINLTNLTIQNSGRNGISFSDFASGTVSENTVSGSGQNGIYFAGSSSGTVSENTVSDSGRTGIDFHDNTAGKILNNTYWA